MTLRRRALIGLSVLYFILLISYVAIGFLRIKMHQLSWMIGTNAYESLYSNYVEVVEADSVVSAERFITMRISAVAIVPGIIMLGLLCGRGVSTELYRRVSVGRIALALITFFIVVWPSMYTIYFDPSAIGLSGSGSVELGMISYWFISVAMVPVFALIAVWCGAAVLRVAFLGGEHGK